MDISVIIIFLFASSVFCGLLNLFIALVTRKSSTDYLLRMQYILHIIFIKSNLPFGILSISLCTHDVLRYDEDYTGFLICIILFIFSFVLEWLLGKYFSFNKTHEHIHDISNPIFSAIDLMNDVLKQKSYLSSAILEYNASLLANIKNVYYNIESTTSVINIYLFDEQQKNNELGKKIDICDKYFERLNYSADLAQKNLEHINQKLSSTNTALAVVENGEKMLKDMNSTFTNIFIGQSMNVNVKIQRILDNLGSIAYKCANIQSFPKPYKDIIDLYSSRIETIFTVLDRKKFYFLWKEYMKAAKTNVYTDPNKAIIDINKAIPINPENPDQYYYRGIIYQTKTEPDYRAALNDFEKALELRPSSNLYLKCIEELKTKIDTTAKEQKS